MKFYSRLDLFTFIAGLLLCNYSRNGSISSDMHYGMHYIYALYTKEQNGQGRTASLTDISDELDMIVLLVYFLNTK